MSDEYGSGVGACKRNAGDTGREAPILEQGGGSNRLVAKGCKEKGAGHTHTHTHTSDGFAVTHCWQRTTEFVSGRKPPAAAG